MKRWLSLLMVGLILFSLAACSSETPSEESSEQEQEPSSTVSANTTEEMELPEGFLLITGALSIWAARIVKPGAVPMKRSIPSQSVIFI